MRRLIIVSNPKSSRAGLVEQRVMEPARKLEGFLVGRYEIQATTLEENVKMIAKILKDGDLVLAAGGDATALIAFNGCMESEKDVVFSALPFGNFNDMAGTLGRPEFEEIIEKFSRGRTKNFYPLEVLIDGKHFRYAAGYATVGMFAESTKIFDQREIRSKLRGGRIKIFSYFQLFKWYLKHKKEDFLPGEMTDFMAVNGTRIGGIMRGKQWFLTQKFSSGRFVLDKFYQLVWFMLKSIFFGIPGEKVGKDSLEFSEKTKVMIQTEGEYREVFCQKIEVVKNRKIKVVMR